MSNYHILSGNNRTFNIVFHIPVTTANNKVDTMSIRSALAEDDGVDKTSIVPWIDAGEQTSLNNGELYEKNESITIIPSETLIEARDRADNRYNELIPVVNSHLQKRYAFWRYNRDVV